MTSSMITSLTATRTGIRLLTTVALLLMSAAAAADKNASSGEATANVWAAAGYTESAVASRDLPGYRPLKRVLTLFTDDEQVAALQAIAPDTTFVAVPGFALPEQNEGDFDAVILGCFNPAALDKAGSPAWIHSYSAGVESCLAHPQIQQMDSDGTPFIMTNSSGTAAAVIAEHAIAMMMSMSRGLHHFRDLQNKAEWQRNPPGQSQVTTTLAGKTMLVLGLGAIGRETAKRANALGMRVTATRNSSRSGPDYVDYVGLADETLALAAQADVIVNALPLTSKTRGLLDEEFFTAMKSSAYMISVGRGGTTDTDALLAALQSGELAGAALDVTDPEPLPAEHPLWRERNVIITPHLAGTGGASLRKVRELLLENLRRYVGGEPMLNEVDSERGY